MAELIDKSALYDAMTEEYKKHYAGDVSASGFTIAMQMVQNQPTTTEAEIRATAEHTYENCHNITCRRKCRKDGYNMAIDEFAEKLKVKFVDFKKSTDIITLGTCIRLINSVAEQLKEE